MKNEHFMKNKLSLNPSFEGSPSRKSSFCINQNFPPKIYKIAPKPKSTLKKPLFKVNMLPGSFNQKSEKIHFMTPIFGKSAYSSRFLSLIRVLLKAVNLLFFNSKLRGLKFINEKQVDLIGDVSYFYERTQKENYLKRYTEKNIIKRMYYHMMGWMYGNKVMVSLKDKFEKILNFFDNYVPIIKPFQKIKVLWDVLILLTIVAFFFIVPLQLSFGFNYEEKLDTFLTMNEFNHILINFISLAPEILLVLDTLLKFITGYYENGVVVIEKSHIIHHYIKKGLILDLLSYTPILVQAILHEHGLTIRLMQLLVFCKLKRIQIIMHNFKEMISLNGKHDYILSLIILIFQIIFFSHINACIWHGVAYYSLSNDMKTWLDYSGIKDLDWTTKYYYSLFWSISVLVTIGFGEKVSPQNNAELLVGGSILLCSALFFGYTINCMREIFDEMAKNEKNYKESLSVMNHYMSRKDVDFELQGRVRKYLEYMMHKESNTVKEEEIMNKLTKALKNELILQANSKSLYKIPLFSKNFSAKVIEELAFTLKEVRFSPEEYIFQKGDIDEFSLFLVSSGNLDLIQENEYGIKSIMSLKKGDVIGARSFFTNDPRESSICTHNFSTLFEIKQSDFIKIIKKLPNDHEKFNQIKDQIKLYSNHQAINVHCFSCFKSTHFYNQCPLIHYTPDKDFIIKRYLYNPTQERRNYNRSFKQKYNALKHYQNVLSGVLCLGSSVFTMTLDDFYEESPTEINNKHKKNEINSLIIENAGFEESKENSACDDKNKFPEVEDQVLLEKLNKKEDKIERNLEEGLKIQEDTPKIQEEAQKNQEQTLVITDETLKIDNENPKIEENDRKIQEEPRKITQEEIIEQVEEKRNTKKITENSKKIIKHEIYNNNNNGEMTKSYMLKRNQKQFLSETNFLIKKTSFENILNFSNKSMMKTSHKFPNKMNNHDNKQSSSSSTLSIIKNERSESIEFDRIKIYDYYFPHNNFHRTVENLIKKESSIVSPSRRNRKKLVENRIRSKLGKFEESFH